MDYTNAIRGSENIHKAGTEHAVRLRSGLRTCEGSSQLMVVACRPQSISRFPEDCKTGLDVRQNTWWRFENVGPQKTGARQYGLCSRQSFR